MNKALLKKLVMLWLGWALILLAFQGWASMRFNLRGPDTVLDWTAEETDPAHPADKPYLSEPFMNAQVAWDSEYYLSIAMQGYADPQIQGVSANYSWQNQHFCTPGLSSDCYSLSNAFFPFYPLAIRGAAGVLNLLPLNISQIGRFTLAGVLVSLLGAMGALIAVVALFLPSLEEEGALRAGFYFLIFPSAFFITQVYSEGLFLGLSLGALALMRARKWGWAGMLAALAAWTRPGGAILLLPLAIGWLQERPWRMGWKPALLHGLAVLAPALAYGVWTLTPQAARFQQVETLYFGRGFLAVQKSWMVWRSAWQHMLSAQNSMTTFYYGLEFAAILLALAGSLYAFKKFPEISLYGIVLLAFTLTSGSAQGMLRYVLAVPGLFYLLAQIGRRPIVDRLWSLLSVSILALECILFTFNYWVA